MKNIFKKIILSTMITGTILIGGLALISPEKVMAITSLPDLESFYKANLTTSISSSATTVNVSSAPHISTGLFVLEPRTTNQEIVYMTSHSGQALTVIRGLANYGSNLTASTTNRSHAAGTGIELADVHYYIKLLQDIILGSTSTPAFIVTSATSTNLITTNATTTNFSATSATTSNLYVSANLVSNLLSAISGQLGSLDVTGNSTLGSTYVNGLFYLYASSSSYIAKTPVTPFEIASKGYVDGVVLTGAPNADEVTKGVTEIATKAEASDGTSVGGTSARLVLPSSMATSTSQVATTSVVVTNTSGKIDSSFLDSISPTGTTTLASTTYIGSTYAFDIGQHLLVSTTIGTTTWSVPNSIHSFTIEGVGGGGGGGGPTGSNTAGSGGGAGGYFKKIVNTTASSTLYIVVGSSVPPSTAGSSTKVFLVTSSGTTTLAVANGGGAGVVGANPPSVGGVGGTATGGDINIQGGDGDDGIIADYVQPTVVTLGGHGGNSMFGVGGKTTGATQSSGAFNGGVARGYGSGGGGTSGSSANGGSGAQGVVIIRY